MHSKSSFLRFSALAILAFMCFPLAIVAAAHPAGSMSLACLAFAPICMEPVDDKPPGSTGAADKPVDVKQALAEVENTALPIGQRISVAIKALQGIDPTKQLADINGQLATAQAKVKEHEGTLATLNEKIKTLEASNVQFSDRATALEKENTDLKGKEQDLEKRAEAKSKEKVAALGFRADNLPAPDAQAATGNLEAAIKAMDSERDPVKKGLLLAQVGALREAASKSPVHGRN